MRVRLFKDGVGWEERRLCEVVSLTFLGPMPADCNFIQHIDGNIKNDNLENLRYIYRPPAPTEEISGE